MEQVMCRSCGEFTRARMDDGERLPIREECPRCGGTEFRDIHADREVRTDCEDTGAGCDETVAADEDD